MQPGTNPGVALAAPKVFESYKINLEFVNFLN
jgi:hypothetical protein